MPKRGKPSKPPRPLNAAQAMLARMAISPEQAAFIRQHVMTRSVCLLCGAVAHWRGMMMIEPEQSEFWGGKRGKFRLIGYALCEPCHALPNLGFRIEARMQADLAGRRN